MFIVRPLKSGVVPSGMLSAQTNSVTSGNTVEITGMIVRDGFPETLIEQGKYLRVQGEGPARLYGKINSSSTYMHWELWRSTDNGATWEQLFSNNSTSSTLYADLNMNLNDGDLLRWTIRSTFGTRSTTSAWLEVTPIES